MYDPLLEHLIELAEAETPVEAEVSLIVGGMLVTGHVVSEEKYMSSHALTRAYLELDAEAEGESDADASEEGDEEDEDDDDFDDDVAYIHLRDAQAAGGKLGFFRVALTDVSGFSLRG
ncbi:hypothetical protein [Lysobacter brunescens]|uniref:Uncharacterized protein n=1 Tax=Lysobacter brunescens TaxID=262323 RepID=A0ABW2YIL5_9GAMM